MLQQILQTEQLIGYILAVEVFFLMVAQLRTNALLKRSVKLRSQRREAAKQLKEEVKKGTSDIPVVKFEKSQPKKVQEQKSENVKKGGYDSSEMAVLQEMMTEFFG
jgi:sortase (surface protein transpeptidase)